VIAARGGEGQNRTADTAIFSRVLCQLSYLAERRSSVKAGSPRPSSRQRIAPLTRFELATFSLTGR
jgi:hypothetical protein